MHRRLTAALLLAALALPAGVAAQPTPPVTTEVSAGTASDSAVGTDGNVTGRDRDTRAPTTSAPTLPALPGAGAPVTTTVPPGSLAPSVTESTTNPTGSTISPPSADAPSPGSGRGNRGNAGADGASAAGAGSGMPTIGDPEPAPAPAPADDSAPASDDAPASNDVAPADDAATSGDAAPADEGSAPPAEAPADAPAEAAADMPAASDACGYPSWLDAQLALEKDADLAATLDPDGDGIACEEAMS